MIVWAPRIGPVALVVFWYGWRSSGYPFAIYGDRWPSFTWGPIKIVSGPA